MREIVWQLQKKKNGFVAVLLIFFPEEAEKQRTTYLAPTSTAHPTLGCLADVPQQLTAAWLGGSLRPGSARVCVCVLHTEPLLL